MRLISFHSLNHPFHYTASSPTKLKESEAIIDHRLAAQHLLGVTMGAGIKNKLTPEKAVPPGVVVFSWVDC